MALTTRTAAELGSIGTSVELVLYPYLPFGQGYSWNIFILHAVPANP
jgi:hypothetical protein